MDYSEDLLRKISWQGLCEVPLADIEEVRRVGSRDSRQRTADQTVAAIFWSFDAAAIWNAAARACLAAKGARGNRVSMLSRVALAIADSAAVAAHLKRQCQSSRPAATIRGEALSRLWPRSLEREWCALIERAPSGETPCATCVVSGAAVAVLRSALGGDSIGISLSDPLGVGLTRRFLTLSEMLQEAEDARVWAGLHFRSTVVESTELGLQLGEMAARSPGLRQ